MVTSILIAQENPVDLNYEKALEMSLTNDPGLEAIDNAINVERQKVNFAVSSYKPKLRAYGNASRTSIENAIEISNPITGTPIVIDISPTNRYRFGLNLAQEIYTFGRRPALNNIARKNLKISKIEKQQYLYRLYQNTTKAFSNMLLTRDLLNISNANIKRAQDKLDIVDARIGEGLAGEYDRVKAELLLSRYENEKIITASRFEQAKTELAELINWDNPYIFFPSGDLSIIDPQIPISPDDDINGRPDLNRLEEFINIQTEQIRVSKSDFFPKLFGSASYDWANAYQPDIEEIKGSWTLGISLNWLFYDGGARKSKLSQTRFSKKVFESRWNDLRSQAASQIISANTALESAQQSLIITERMVDLADKGLKIAESQYDEGLLSISDLIDIEIDKSSAEASLIKSRYELILKKLDLKAASGYYPELSSYLE
jgi:outer membrane protein TolC